MSRKALEVDAVELAAHCTQHTLVPVVAQMRGFDQRYCLTSSFRSGGPGKSLGRKLAKGRVQVENRRRESRIQGWSETKDAVVNNTTARCNTDRGSADYVGRSLVTLYPLRQI